LGAAGYVTGTITLQNHNVIPAGYVISQSPGDDASLAAGGAVDLVISAGPDGVALITVPDVAGLAQADAETTLTNAGLTVNVTTTFSDTVAAGTVISQSPAAGTDVSAGTTVDLVVSAGPAPTTISVPDVTGLSQAAAETALTNAGLVVGSVTSVSSDTIAAGDVISQTPVATTDVAPGTTVDLVVSSGPALVPVPGVTGLTQTDAETAIVNAGLIVGTVTAANSDTVPAGNVISQSPGAATNVAPGSAVDLLVSTGPALITVPGVVGLAQSVAETAITNAGLTVGSVTTTASNTIPAGDVISQSPASGVEVAAGSSVDLVVSTGPDLITVPDVEGRSYSTATDIINAAGLSVGTVSTTFTRRSCGVVVNQSPNGGTSVQAGTQVDLVVTRTWRCNPL
jgi:beta-lactam-binding protein with PASTA domain